MADEGTTVGMILGLVTLTAGNIEVFGRELKDNSWTNHLALLDTDYSHRLAFRLWLDFPHQL